MTNNCFVEENWSGDPKQLFCCLTVVELECYLQVLKELKKCWQAYELSSISLFNCLYMSIAIFCDEQTSAKYIVKYSMCIYVSISARKKASSLIQIKKKKS